MAGSAVRTQQVNVCNEIRTDDRVAPWRAELLKNGYESLIGLPLVWGGNCMGALTVYSVNTLAFQQREIELFMRLAADLTYGIIALRARAERAQLQEELLKISEREKQVIAQEIHDGLCQQLVGTAMMGSLLHRRLAAREDPEADQAKQICDLLNSGAQEARNLAHGLHPVRPEPEGLMDALAGLARMVTNLFQIQCAFRCEAPVHLGDPAVATNLFRMAQEAVNNAMKHGKAKEVLITLEKDRFGITLSIRDNGIGIPLGASASKGMGMQIMSHRAATIGGNLAIRRDGSKGTLVVCKLPSAASSSPSKRNKTAPRS